MTQTRRGIGSATTQNARPVTLPRRPVRAAARTRPAAVSWQRSSNQPDPHFVVPLPLRDTCLRSSRQVACHSRTLRFDQSP